MLQRLALMAALATAVFLPACGSGSADSRSDPFVVNSLLDLTVPPEDIVTLRSALAAAPSGQRITFDPVLDGGTIALTTVAAEHSVLKGEVMGMRIEPSGPVSYLVGYFDRDYGRSALYADRDVVIDASALPSGITLAWAGPEDDDARVLAVYGDLDLTNVTIRGGRSTTVELPTEEEEDQPWTLARGAGVAVWGTARLRGCTLYDNHCVGDFDSSRDRGAFGGGLYANIVDMEDCVVCGNTILGAGAAGGGVFSVGGADDAPEDISRLRRCAVTGNRIQALFTYGGGVYSDGGGIGERKVLHLENCTVARNVVEPPALPPSMSFLLGMGYWRGGGVYMSNGYAWMHGCTIVENEVYGVPRVDDLGKQNLAGGVAATIGNAHAVEEMVFEHSIVAGNVVHELGFDGLVTASYAQDVFSGSLLYFRSMGHNRFGDLDFSQILVPVGQRNWKSLSRKHYPKQGDADGVEAHEVLDLDGGVTTAPGLLSAGVGAGSPTVLFYEPAGSALDQVPAAPYAVPETFAEFWRDPGATDDFLAILLARLEAYTVLPGFAAGFQADFEAFLQTVDSDEDTPGVQPYTDPGGTPILTLADTHWFGPAETWPKELPNYPWIHFWHRLEEALEAAAVPGMGPELLGDAEWDDLFEAGELVENPGLEFWIETEDRGTGNCLDVDQRSLARPANAAGDIGAIEMP